MADGCRDEGGSDGHPSPARSGGRGGPPPAGRQRDPPLRVLCMVGAKRRGQGTHPVGVQGALRRGGSHPFKHPPPGLHPENPEPGAHAAWLGGPFGALRATRARFEQGTVGPRKQAVCLPAPHPAPQHTAAARRAPFFSTPSRALQGSSCSKLIEFSAWEGPGEWRAGWGLGRSLLTGPALPRRPTGSSPRGGGWVAGPWWPGNNGQTDRPGPRSGRTSGLHPLSPQDGGHGPLGLRAPPATGGWGRGGGI